MSSVQLEHRKHRAAVISNGIGIAACVILVIPTHGASFIPLVYKIPMFIKALKKWLKLRDWLKKYGIPKLSIQMRDLVIPLVAVGLAAGIGLDVDAQLGWDNNLRGSVNDEVHGGVIFKDGALEGISNSLQAHLEVAEHEVCGFVIWTHSYNSFALIQHIPGTQVPAGPSTASYGPTPGFHNSVNAFGSYASSLGDHFSHGADRLSDVGNAASQGTLLTAGYGRNFGEAMTNVAIGEFVECIVKAVLTRLALSL